MALIKCVECGKEFSNYAMACPNCACPIEIINEKIKAQSKSVEEPTTNNEENNLILSIIRSNKDSKVKAIQECSKLLNLDLKSSKLKVDEYYSTLVWRTCVKCNKDIFDNDLCCPYCGDDINEQKLKQESLILKLKSEQEKDNLRIEKDQIGISVISTAPTKSSGLMCCPICKSTSITTKSQGFGAGKAAIGAALLGPIGLLGGAVGSNKTILKCLSCGYEHKV